jgi:glutathione synthase/RimK-type ligase-like ATP-grasp enzyme
MQNVLILLDDLSLWKPYYPSESVITASDYLRQESYEDPKLVINLCSEITYNSEGYYCSLLATARGHRVIPNAEVLNKLESGSGIRMDSNLHRLCHNWIEKNNISSEFWYLDVYFGSCFELGLERIARYIFDNYPYPILRVTLNNKSRNQIESIKPLKLSELTDDQQSQFADALDRFNRKVWRNPRSKKSPRYDLAIFHNPDEPFPPSNRKALAKFVDLAKKMNINAELITEDDLLRLMEFDALFIRQTTALNHITYQVAQKAKQADMVVIDDPLSIIRCTNKVYLNELLAREGIPAPKSKLIFRAKPFVYDEVASCLGAPFILKIPDGSFSNGVKKVKNFDEYQQTLNDFFGRSAIVLAQEYLPTDFDWRIGVLNGEPLYACKYFMAKGHWQIYYHQSSGKSRSGMAEAVPMYKVPKVILKNAIKATSLIGKGLYGVDLKMIGDKGVIIEINDNPSLDYGIEDAILGDELYYRIINEFVRKLENKHH